MVSHEEFTGWHKSTASDDNNGGCVEIGYAPGARGIRDTTLGSSSPVAEVSEVAFQQFLAEVKADGLLR